MFEIVASNESTTLLLNTVTTNNGANRITGTIKKGINAIDSFTFTIYPNHPAYNKLHPFSTRIKVTNTMTGVDEFIGRVLLTRPMMDNNGVISTQVICESELGYLNDSISIYGEYHDKSVDDFLKIILNHHNNQVSADKKFEVGNVEVEGILYRYLGYDKTFATIKDKLLDRLGGELKIRYHNGVRYLDYVKEIGEKKNTEICLAKNLITIEQEQDPSAIISRLIPLGAKLNDTDERLTISNVNNGSIYIDDEDAIKKFGIISGSETWDDVTIDSNLFSKAQDFQKENNRIKKAHKISALDLSLIGLDIDSFEVGNYYRVINPLMGIDEDLRIIEKNIQIEAPQSSTLIIGDKFTDIKDYQLQNFATAKEVEMVKGNVNVAFKNISNVSVELTNVANNLNGANTTIADLTNAVNANIEATSKIIDSMNVINERLDKIIKRLNMEV